MWCTRWFLPLLLLPLPTAPPYFLLLFLFSLTIHAKPCFYCIVLLTTLFVSSCYWQPFPIDSQLSMPWSENITTFAEALNATLSPNYTRPLPNVMKAVDRCWCDFSAGGFFEPFNVSHWERVSIQKLKEDLDRQESADEDEDTEDGGDHDSTEGASYGTIEPQIPRTPASEQSTEVEGEESSIWADLWSFFRPPKFGSSSSEPASHLPTPPPNSELQASAQASRSAAQPSPTPDLPLLRREYDLHPYGFGIVIDFGWTR